MSKYITFPSILSKALRWYANQIEITVINSAKRKVLTLEKLQNELAWLCTFHIWPIWVANYVLILYQFLLISRQQDRYYIVAVNRVQRNM